MPVIFVYTGLRWSEEFQEWFYREQITMMKKMPSNFVGLSPWILADFRSPKRNNPVYLEGWNNKGLFDQKGNKKKAFYVLKAYYDEMEKKQNLFKIYYVTSRCTGYQMNILFN